MKTSPSEDKSQLLSLADAAEMYGFSPDYLRNLVNKGRLAARKIGGVWITTTEDVEAYINSRQQRGRFRDDIIPA